MRLVTRSSHLHRSDYNSFPFVFLNLPKVIDAERDINKAKRGAGEDAVYKTLTGLKSDLTVQSKPKLLEESVKSPAQPSNEGL